MYGGNAFSHPAEDIIGPRYPSPLEMEVQVGMPSTNPDRRPSFMDEYVSVAGNGGGGLDDYWDVIYRYPRLMGGAIWDFVSTGVTEPIRSIVDSSPNNTPVHLMGRATLVKDGNSNVLDLNGHDQWVEVYRQDNVEIAGDKLTLTFRVFPRKLSSSSGSYLTKVNNQFGIQQKGKECLEFYLYTNRRYTICAPLPDDWEYQWHDVAATYDGEEMSLYINKEKKASAKVSGNIRNFPFPVNIGRNAESHGQETNVYICDARLDNVGIFTNEVDINNPDLQKAVLWLDFEKEQHNGFFYSYGIGARTYGSIWPDRKPQPEMWQMKKSVQPLSFRLMDAQTGTIEVWNRNHFVDAGYYQTRLQLEADGKILQSGELNLTTPPLNKEHIKIPFTKPAINAGSEYRINLSSTLKKDELWAPAGHEVSWEQLELPWYQAPAPEPVYQGKAPVCSETPETLTVSGTDFKYSFDKQKGQLVSVIFKGKEMLRSPLTLNLWRAPLANELDSWNSWTARSDNRKQGYGNSISTEMYSLGVDRLTHIPVSFKSEEKYNEVHISIHNVTLMSGGGRNGFRNDFTFIIKGDGKMTLHHRIKPEGTMPLWLPRIGISMTLDKSLNHVKWYGRGPQENYPDRKTGYRINIYHNTVQNMYEPYLIPQDHGLRTDNRWVNMTDSQGAGMKFSVDELFNFNAYPYSTDNLTKAMYTYQIQEQDGITFNLDYATSGVGCTSQGIFSAYRAMPQVYERVITIEPVK
jgi:beta-galactosidase